MREITYLEAVRRRGYDFGLYQGDGIVNALNRVLRHAMLSGEPVARCWNPKDSVFYVNRWPAPAHSHSVYPTEPYAAYDWMPCLREAAPEVLVEHRCERPQLPRLGIVVAGGTDQPRKLLLGQPQQPLQIQRSRLLEVGERLLHVAPGGGLR